MVYTMYGGGGVHCIWIAHFVWVCVCCIVHMAWVWYIGLVGVQYRVRVLRVAYGMVCALGELGGLWVASGACMLCPFISSETHRKISPTLLEG